MVTFNMRREIKNIVFKIIETIKNDDSKEYFIEVHFKIKGMLWGWNDCWFVVTHDYPAYLASFYGEFDSQAITGTIRPKKFVSTEAAEYFITRYKELLKDNLEKDYNNLIKQVNFIKEIEYGNF